MPAAPIPAHEAARLAALQSYDIMDSASEESLDTAAWLAARITGCPIALVSLVDGQRQWFKARHGLELTETPRDQAFCCHAILEPSQPLVVRDATRDPRFADNPLVTGSMGIRFYAGVPLVDAEGHALGTLCILDKTPRDITEETLDMLTAVAMSVVSTLELRRKARDLRRLITTDALTGLANRTAFLADLSTVVADQHRGGAGFGVILVNIDGFRNVNAKLGAIAGDRILILAADAVLPVFGEDVTIARLGDHEIGAILPGAGRSAIAEAAERIRAAIEGAMEDNGLSITASVGGVAFGNPPASAVAAYDAANGTLAAAQLIGRNSVLCRDAEGADPLLARARARADQARRARPPAPAQVPVDFPVEVPMGVPLDLQVQGAAALAEPQTMA